MNHRTLQDLRDTVSHEAIEAHNAGRYDDERAFRRILRRMDALDAVADDNALFELVRRQATSLLHSVWKKHPIGAAAQGDEG